RYVVTARTRKSRSASLRFAKRPPSVVMARFPPSASALPRLGNAPPGHPGGSQPGEVYHHYTRHRGLSTAHAGLLARSAAEVPGQPVEQRLFFRGGQERMGRRVE